MYCPKIQSDQLRLLFFLKNAYSKIGIKKPITKIVREAIENHIPFAISEIKSKGGSIPNELIDH